MKPHSAAPRFLTHLLTRLFGPSIQTLRPVWSNWPIWSIWPRTKKIQNTSRTSKISRQKQLALFLTTAVLLSGCGYHLRSKQSYDNLNYRSLAILGQTQESVAEELQDIMSEYITTERYTNLKDPQTIAIDEDIAVELGELSLFETPLYRDSAGKVTDFRLGLLVEIQVFNQQHKLLVPPTKISVYNTMASGTGYTSAYDLEKKQMFNAMSVELAKRIENILLRVDPNRLYNPDQPLSNIIGPSQPALENDLLRFEPPSKINIE